MKPAAENMSDKINQINFKEPLFQIVNNVTAKALENSSKIKKLLVDQIYSTVNGVKA